MTADPTGEEFLKYEMGHMDDQNRPIGLLIKELLKQPALTAKILYAETYMRGAGLGLCLSADSHKILKDCIRISVEDGRYYIRDRSDPTTDLRGIVRRIEKWINKDKE